MDPLNPRDNQGQEVHNQVDQRDSSFAQYLSFRFYKENLHHLADYTRGSINNFLKTIQEIEEEFRGMMRTQRPVDLHDFGFNIEGKGSMEENY